MKWKSQLLNMLGIHILEPVKMIGEGEYNLYDLKDLLVTDSYLGLDQDVRNCQHEESFQNCTTRHLVEKLQEECGCLPLNMIYSNKVSDLIFFVNFHCNMQS